MTERWRRCRFGPYSASSCGRLRAERPKSLRRSAKIIKQSTHAKGYLVVWLRSDDGSHATVLVHRLVALAFLGPCPAGKQVNHKNGDKADNRIANLEYVTPSENHLHAFRTGLRSPKRGAESKCSSLSDCEVSALKARRAAGERGVDLAVEYGVSAQTICNIVKGRTWAHRR